MHDDDPNMGRSRRGSPERALGRAKLVVGRKILREGSLGSKHNKTEKGDN